MSRYVKISGGDGIQYRVSEKVFKEASDELKAQMAQDREKVNFIDSEAEDHYSMEIPPGDRTFLLAQLALEELQPAALELNPELTVTESKKARDRGIVVGSFGNWTIALNHSPNKVGRLYGGNMLIKYKGATGSEREVAIIGPWLTARRCWNCGLAGLGPGGVGVVKPAHPCPKCGELDWWDTDVTPEQLERDCATLLADASPVEDQERRYNSFTNIRK